MKGCKDDEGTRALLIVGKAETSGAVQPEEDKTEGDLLNAYRCLKGRFKDRVRLFPVVPSDRTREQWAQTKTQGIPSQHQEKLLYSQSDCAWAQVAWGDGGVYPLGHSQKPP